MLLGNPLLYSSVLLAWIIVGLVIGICARRTGGAILSAFVVYALTWIFLIASSVVIFRQVFPSGLAGVFSSSSPGIGISVPSIPSGTNIATIFKEPLIDKVPDMLTNGLFQQGATPEVAQILSSFLVSMAENFLILVVTASLVGFGVGRLSHSLKTRSRKHWLAIHNNGNFTKTSIIILIVLLLALTVFAPKTEIANAQNSSSSSSLNFSMTGSLVQNQGIYYLTMILTPSFPGTFGYLMLSADEANSLVSGLISQLENAGFATPTAYFVSVAPTYFLNTQAIAVIDTLLSAPSTVTDLFDNAEIGGVSGFALTTYQAWADQTQLPPAPPQIVAALVNNLFSTISSANEQEAIQNNYPFYDASTSTSYTPAYIIGVGQEFIITLEGVTPPAGNSFSLDISGSYAYCTGNTLNIDTQTASGAAVGVTSREFSGQIQISRDYFLWFALGWSVTVTFTETSSKILSNNIMGPPSISVSSSYYQEAVYALANGDGSSVNMYSFLTVPPSSQNAPFYSANPGLSGVILALVFSQSCGSTFLPGAASQSFSSIEQLIPPTFVMLLYSGDIASSQTKATELINAISSAYNLNDVSLLFSVDNSQAASGYGSPVCLFIYGSDTPFGIVAEQTSTGFLPSMHSDGLVNILEQGIDSGFLVPGATPYSVDGAMLVSGFANNQLLSNVLSSVFPLTTQASSTSLDWFVGMMTIQSNAFHSSNTIHTVNFAQLVNYSSPVGFAPDSTFSIMAVGTPTSSENTGGFLQGHNLSIYTNNNDLATSATEAENDGLNVTVIQNGVSIQPEQLQSSFNALLPAELSISKTFSQQKDGTIRVSLSVKNLDDSSLTNLVMDDSAFMNSYGEGVTLVSGEPKNNSVTELAPGATASYSYIIKMRGLGSYVSPPATFSYVNDGESFSTHSSTTVWNQPEPDVFSATWGLISSFGVTNLGAAILGALILILLALAVYSEYRSLRGWLDSAKLNFEEGNGRRKILLTGHYQRRVQPRE
jgi:hypothetical protein